MTNTIQWINQTGDLSIKNTSTVEIVLPKLDMTKIVMRNCHVYYTQRINNNDNIIDTMFIQKHN